MQRPPIHKNPIQGRVSAIVRAANGPAGDLSKPSMPGGAAQSIGDKSVPGAQSRGGSRVPKLPRSVTSKGRRRGGRR